MSTDARDDVVRAARQWLGTPFCHRASRRGVGCDCLGLIRGIRRELQGAEPEPIPFYSSNWAVEDTTEPLWQAMKRHLLELPVAAETAPGQVLLFRMRAGAAAWHVGILSTGGNEKRFIHAYERHGVIESPLSAPWARRIVARFDLT